jgi:lipopolysaccharide exporter
MDPPADRDVRSAAELTEASASGLRVMTYVRVAIEVVLLGAMVVLARLITPAEFGMYAIVVIVQELSISMPMEGIGSALVQRRSIQRHHLQAGLVLSLAVGIVLAVVTIGLAVTLVASVYGHETSKLVLMATPWYVICAIYAVPMALLRRRLDFTRLSLLDLANSTVRAAASIALALGGLGASALVLGNLASSVVCLALALRFAPIPLPRWRRDAARDLLGYGGPAALACIAWTGFRNGDYAVIGAKLGTAQAGFYWRGYQLAVEYQKKISVIMSQIAFPVLARAGAAEDRAAIRRRMVQLLTVVLFPLLVLLVLLAPTVVPWLFGPAWEPAVVPTQVLAAGGAATLVIDGVGSALMAEGRSRALLGFGVAHFAVYIGAVIVVASHGLVAVAGTAAVVHSLFVVVAYQMLFRVRGLALARVLWRDLAPASVASVALAATAGPVTWLLDRTGVPAPLVAVAAVAAGAAAYAAALHALFPASWRDLASAIDRILPTRIRRARHPAVAPAPDEVSAVRRAA